MKKALYAGTFDPLHLGHWDLIERSLKIFDELVVAVAAAHHKNTMFSLEQRLNILQSIKENRKIDNLKIISFDGLLIDLAQELKINCLIRGLRDSSDFAFEARLWGLNNKLNPNFEVIFLPSKPELSFLNSSFLRETYKLGGDISQFVLPELWEKLND